MVAHVATAAYLGLEARAVEVQVQVAPGVPAFVVVGLPDKAVAESRERVRAAMSAIGLALMLKNSIWAKKLYARLKRRYPKRGEWVDWSLRRRSALRRARKSKAGRRDD